MGSLQTFRQRGGDVFELLAAASPLKLGKATGSRNHKCILLGQGPCALTKCFASTETRRHDVGQAASAQLSPRESGLLRWH